jgi:hypothetical protein
LFPRIRKDFKGKASIPRRLRRGFLFKHQRRGTETRKVFAGSRAFYRQSACFVSFHRKPPSRPLVKLIDCQISTLLSLFALFAFAVNSLPLCQLTELPQIQMSFGTGSIEKMGIFCEIPKHFLNINV